MTDPHSLPDDVRAAAELVEQHVQGVETGPTDLPPSITDALRRGQKIEAIKLLREYTGLGLAEAKRMVESMDHDTAARHAAPGIHPESRNWVWVIIALAIVGYLAYLWLADAG